MSDNEFKVSLVAAIGPVKAKFSGKLLLNDVNPPHSYALAFEGSGGAAGFGKGTAEVKLTLESDGTKLWYSAKASVGGKLAQIGSRLIDGVAKKMADDFFKAFTNKLGGAAPAAAPAAAAPAAAAATPGAAPAPVAPGAAVPTTPSAPAKSGMSPLTIIIGVVAIIAILGWLLR